MIELARNVHTTCPRCRINLKDLHEDFAKEVCPSCKGRFLPKHQVERLVREMFSADLDAIRSLMKNRKSLSCPDCTGYMTAIRFRGVEADVCKTCNGMWLDAAELRALSGGRYERLKNRVKRAVRGGRREGETFEQWNERVHGVKKRRWWVWVVVVLVIAAVAFTVVRQRYFAPSIDDVGDAQDETQDTP